MKVFGIIPARYGSTRLPAKVLADIGGRPLIRRVYERAVRSAALNSLTVATDDERILKTVKSFGGEAVMTAREHPSGTDRVAEAARILGAADGDLVVNIQADQPFFEPGMIEEIVLPFREDPGIDMGALVFPITDKEELANPSVVKVVADRRGFALYFSRSPIPYAQATGSPVRFFKHIGPYAYRFGFLREFTGLPRGELEACESLEQLRALEHGRKIRIVETRYDSHEVDTPEDLEKARARSRGPDGRFGV